MKALILAAGLGSRLKENTANRPKALVPVNGKPILAYQLEALLTQKLHDIGIVLGYRGQDIIDFITEKYPTLDVRYFWNRNFEKSNSSYSFWCAHEWVLRESYLHLNCDILFSAELLRKILQSPRENLIAIHGNVPLCDGLENVALERDRITRMSLHHFHEASAKAFGLAKLGPASTRCVLQILTEHLEKGDRNQNYYGLLRKAIFKLPYFALDAAGDMLLEINTSDDLSRAERSLASHSSYF